LNVCAEILSWCFSLVSDVLPIGSLLPPAPLAVANFWLYVLSVVPPAMMALEVFYMWTSRFLVNLVRCALAVHSSSPHSLLFSTFLLSRAPPSPCSPVDSNLFHT
jgi:hypothetical protein